MRHDSRGVGIDASHCGPGTDWHASDDAAELSQLAWLPELVGLYSRSLPRKSQKGCQHQDGTSCSGGVYSPLDVAFDRPARLARLLRTPQREDAAPKSPEARRQFTRTEPSPAGVRETVRRRAWDGRARNERQTGAARTTRRRGSTGTNPVRRGARLAETAIAREAAARRRRGGPGSLSLSVFLSPALGRSTTRSTVFVK